MKLLNYLFIRKADYNSIEKILTKENFEYTREDIEKLLKGNQKGIRYGNMVLLRNENGQKIKRFLKIMLDGNWKTFKPFERQVRVSIALNEDTHYKSPTVKVIDSFLKFPIPYAIFETREDGPNFGFMNDTPKSYENFTDKEMSNLINTIYNFHLSGRDMDENIWQYTGNVSSNIKTYQKEIETLLKQVITHKKIDGTVIEDTVENILKTYFQTKNLYEKIIKEFRKNFIKIKNENRKYLVHADMQIDNLYKHKDGSIELLDFEWVSKTNSPSLAIMYDYGNLRARAWSSTKFQEMLDSKMLEIGKKHYDENNVKTGLNLGLLRSSMIMSRFHLDFKNTVKKDKRTEEDYFLMFPKTIESLRKAIS